MRFLWTLGALGYLSGCTGVFTVKPQDETGISRANERPTASDLLLETDEDTPLSFRLAGYDADLDPLTYSHTEPDPTAGTLSGTPPDLSFVPVPDFASADAVTFTYTVSDGSKESLPATVSIFVKNVNDTPVATDLDVTTAEEVETTITLAATDVEDDAAGIPLVYGIQNDPAFGSLDESALPDVVYRSNDDFSGIDSFTYFVTDSSGSRSGYATVTVTVTDVNDAPVPGADAYVMDEDTILSRSASAGLLANDTNLEDDTLEVASNTLPDSGTLVVNADGSFTYTPEADYSGTVSFSYVLTDGTETLADATPVTIEVESVPDAPRIVDEPSYAVVEDTLFSADVLDDCSADNAGLLCAAFDPDVGDELAVSLIDVDEPEHAVVFEVNADGSFTYQPEENYTGFDSFQYRVIDSGFLVSDFITVTLSVSPQNDPPVSAPDSYTVDEDGALLVGLGTGLLLNDSDVDGDELFVDSYTIPVVETGSGTDPGTLNVDPDGTFDYTPAADFNGSVTFTYLLTDGETVTESAETVSITVLAQNDRPTAGSLSYDGVEDEDLIVNEADGLLSAANDIDEGDTLTATLESEVTIFGTDERGGTITVNPDGSFELRPDSDVNGVLTFSFSVSDGALTTELVSVTVTLAERNDAPVSLPDAYPAVGTWNEDEGPFVVGLDQGLLLNDSDVDLDDLTAELVTDPLNGDVSLSSNGTFTYTPDPDFFGIDTFTYRAFDGSSDGTGYSEATTVTLTITAVNDDPVALPDSATGVEDEVLDVSSPGVLANDSDVDDADDALLVEVVTPPLHGTVVLEGDGGYRYTPNENANKLTIGTPGVPTTDSFTYQITDAGGATSDEVAVTLTIEPVNDAPVASGDFFDVEEDVALIVPAPGVLENDSDIDLDVLTASLQDTVEHGTLVFNADGSFSYTPDLDYTGADTFSYLADDGNGGNSDVVTVYLDVGNENDAPVSVDDDGFETDEDTLLFVPATEGLLINDTDGDDDPLTAVLASPPANGTVSLSATGQFTYEPALNFNGEDTFTYNAYDGKEQSLVASTVRILVKPVNDAPTAVDDLYGGTEDTVLTRTAAAGLLSNDSDLDGDSVSVSGNGDASVGSVVVQSDGAFDYTPPADFNGEVTFTYTIADPDGETSVATATLNIAAVNDNPVGVSDTYETNEDESLTKTAAFGVLANDTDVDADGLRATLLTSPSFGTLSLGDSGAFLYVPDANYIGEDTFVYQAVDTAGGTSGPVTVTITVKSVNDAPVVSDDAYDTVEDVLFSVNAASGVLANDTDIDFGAPEGDELTVYVVSAPSHGILTLAADGSFTYDSDDDFNGTDTFEYVAEDNDGALSTSGLVVLTVAPVNDAPIGANDDYTVAEDGVLESTPFNSLLANDTDVDGDDLYVVLPVASLPDHGLLLELNDEDGTFVYQPDADFNGTDSFTYQVKDREGSGGLVSSVHTVTITVTAVDDAPVALDDDYTINEDETLSEPSPGVLSNDTDVEDDALTAELRTTPSNGDVTLNADGSFIYVPDADFYGDDSFTYIARANGLAAEFRTVSLEILPVNDPTVANDDYFSTPEDTLLNGVSVLTNDVDIDTDVSILSVYKVSDPTMGTLTLNSDGTFTYDPDEGETGIDTFTYRVDDGSADFSEVATVTIDVGSVNDAPVGVADGYTINEDETLSVDAAIGVLDNDTDADGDDLSATVISTTTNGTLTFSSSGAFTYVPNSDYNGFDQFTYQATDGVAATDIVLVTLTVTAVNDAPIALDDSYELFEEATLNVVVLDGGVLDNDSDAADGVSVVSEHSAELVTDVSQGTLSLSSNGSFTYTPDVDAFGVDTFTYRIPDGDLYSNTATVTLEIEGTNDAPMALDDDYFVEEDTTLSITDAEDRVLYNDEDVDGDALTAGYDAAENDGPDNGSVTMAPNGSFTYVPDANFYGTDTFTYTVFDGTVEDTATVTITVGPIDDAPIALGETVPMDEDTTLILDAPGVMTNEVNVDPEDTLTVTLVDDVTNGTLVLGSDGRIEYTPTPDFYGDDTFTYTVTDTITTVGPVTTTLEVGNINDAPVVGGVTYDVTEDTTLSVGAADGVLRSTTDPDGALDTLTVALATAPTSGTLTSFNSDGSFVFEPTPGWSTNDSFTFTVTDGTVEVTGTAILDFDAVNDAPVASPRSFDTDEDFALICDGAGCLLDPTYVSDSDDPMSELFVKKISDPVNGTVTIDDASAGTFTYTPNTNYNGTDSFSYAVSDGDLDSETMVVTIEVEAVNDFPTTVDDTYEITEDGILTVTAPGLLVNDSDVDGDAITVVSVDTDGTAGEVSFGSDGSISYTPAEDFFGADSFEYVISDGELSSDSARVTINVNGDDDVPDGFDDVYEVNEDEIAEFDRFNGVLANDIDADGDTLYMDLSDLYADDGPELGVATFAIDGSFTYAPNENEDGDRDGETCDDIFEYRFTDGEYDSTAVVCIKIQPVNDAPVALDDSYSVSEDDVLTSSYSVLDNDTDVEEDERRVAADEFGNYIVDDVLFGDLTLSEDGNFVYEPDPNFTGTDTFTYRVKDCVDAGCNTSAEGSLATVSINVTPLPDAPTVSDLTLDVAEDGTVFCSTTPCMTIVDDDFGYTEEVGDHTFELINGAVHGSLTLNSDGTYVYSPTANYYGSDSFTYEVTGTDGLQDTGIATITVEPQDDAPVCEGDPSVVGGAQDFHAEVRYQVGVGWTCEAHAGDWDDNESFEFSFTWELDSDGDSTVDDTLTRTVDAFLSDEASAPISAGSGLFYRNTSTTDVLAAGDFATMKRGDKVQCRVTVSDDLDSCSADSDVIDVENARPMLDDVFIDVSALTVDDDLVCNATAEDLDGDDMTYTFSLVQDNGDGAIIGDQGVTTSATSASATFDLGVLFDDGSVEKGDTLACSVSVSDGIDTAFDIKQDSASIINALPTVSVEITAADGGDLDRMSTARCSATGSDADGDDIEYQYVYFIDPYTPPSGGYTSDVFRDVNLAAYDTLLRGETIECTVTPRDEDSPGLPVVATAVIENALPYVDSIAISVPSGVDPTITSTLSCDAVGADHDPSDSVTLSYVWGVTGLGTFPDETSSTIDLSTFGTLSKGNEVYCTATPYDDNEPSEAGTSDTATITLVNETPTVDAVAVTVSGGGDALITSTLDCTATGVADADEDPVTVSFTWTSSGHALEYDGGSVVAAGGAADVSVSVDALRTTWVAQGASLEKGDTLTCTASTDDGTTNGAGEAASGDMELKNSLPVAGAVSVTSGDRGDTVTCSVAGSTDADGDDLRYDFEWSIDGAVVGNSGWTALGSTSASLNLANESTAAEGLEVSCTATPDDDGEADDGTDDEDHSTVGTSSTGSMTIENAVPEVSVTLDGPSSLGADLTCNATISDLDLDDQTVSLVWSIDTTGSGFVDIITVPSTITASATSPTTGTVTSTIEVGVDLVVAEDDSMKCTVTSDDGDAEASAESVKVVGDSIPVMDVDLTSNLTPVTGESAFTCTANVLDPDAGDSVTATFEWSVDGAVLFTESMSASSSGLIGTVTSSQTAVDLFATKGEVVTCTLTAQDQDSVAACDVDDASTDTTCNTGTGGLTLTESVDSLTLENHVPEIDDVQISSAVATGDPSVENFDFICDVSLTEYDLDDTVSVAVRLQIDPASGADSYQIDLPTTEMVRAGSGSAAATGTASSQGGADYEGKVYVLDDAGDVDTVYDDVASFYAAGGTLKRGDAVSCVVAPFEGSPTDVNSYIETGAPALVAGIPDTSGTITLLNAPPQLLVEMVVTDPAGGALSDDSTVECQVTVADRDGDTGTLEVDLKHCDEACQLCDAACADTACSEACSDSLDLDTDAAFDTLHFIDDCSGAAGLSTCSTSAVLSYTLDPNTVSKDDSIRCYVSFDDANGGETTGLDFETVDNDAPTITNIQWQNELAVADSSAPIDQAMTCRVDVSDANSGTAGATEHTVNFTFYEAGDPGTTLLSISKEAEEAGSTATDTWTSYTLVPQTLGLAKGEQLVCAATVTDGTYSESVSAQSTASLSLVNDVPEVDTTTLQLAGGSVLDTVYVTDDVTCSVVVNEVDGDSLCARFEMTVSSGTASTANYLSAVAVVGGTATSAATSVQTALSAAKGDDIVCNVDLVERLDDTEDCSALDSNEVGAADASRVVGSPGDPSNTIEIADSPSQVTSVELDNLTPFVTDTVTCTFSPFDADYEVLNYTLTWLIDGEIVPGPSSVTDTAYTDISHTLTLSDEPLAVKGATIQCDVEVENDGTVSSNVSDIAFIQDSVPTVPDDGSAIVFEAFDAAGNPIDEASGDELTRDGTLSCTLNFSDADSDELCARFDVVMDPTGVVTANYPLLGGTTSVTHVVDLSSYPLPTYSRGNELTCRADVQQGNCGFSGGSFANTSPGTGTELMSATVVADDTFTIENAPPVAVDDSVEIPEDSGLYSGDVASNDTDLDDDLNGTLVSYATTSLPSTGTLVFSGDGTFSYTPDANFNGVETFTYEVDDGYGGTDTGTVTITVTSVNDLPNFGGAKSYDWVYGSSLVVGLVGSEHLLDGMSDQDGTLTIKDEDVLSNIAGALVELNSDGTFKYHSENENSISSDTFTFTVEETNDDGTSESHDRTATINFVSTENIWYVENNYSGGACAGKNGHEDCPFTTLSEVEAISDADDVIYIKPGDGTTSGHDAGFVMQGGQQIYGSGVALVIDSVEVEAQDLSAETQLSSTGLDDLGYAISLTGSTGGATFTVKGLSIVGGYGGIGVQGDGLGMETYDSTPAAFDGTLDVDQVDIRGAVVGIMFGDMQGDLIVSDSDISGATDAMGFTEYYAPTDDDLDGLLTSTAKLVDANCDGSVDSGSYDSDRFVELYNYGVQTKELGGYALGVREGGSVSTFHTFGAGMSVAPGGSLVVFGDDCVGSGCTIGDGRLESEAEAYWYGLDEDGDGYFDTAGARNCNASTPSSSCSSYDDILCDPSTPGGCSEWTGWDGLTYIPSLARPTSFFEAEVNVDSSIRFISEIDYDGLGDGSLRASGSALESACAGATLEFDFLVMGESGQWIRPTLVTDETGATVSGRFVYEVPGTIGTVLPSVSGTDVFTFDAPVEVRADGTITIRVVNRSDNSCMSTLSDFDAYVYTYASPSCSSAGTCTSSLYSRMDITGVGGGSEHCATETFDTQYDVVDDALPQMGTGAEIVFVTPSGDIESRLVLTDNEDASTDGLEASSCFDAGSSEEFKSLVGGEDAFGGDSPPFTVGGWRCQSTYGDDEFGVHPGWLDEDADFAQWGLTGGIVWNQQSLDECATSMTLTNVNLTDLGIGVIRGGEVQSDSCASCTSTFTYRTDTWTWSGVAIDGSVDAEGWPVPESMNNLPVPFAVLENVSFGGSDLTVVERQVEVGGSSSVTDVNMGWVVIDGSSRAAYDFDGMTYTNVAGTGPELFSISEVAGGPAENAAIMMILSNESAVVMDGVDIDGTSGGIDILNISSTEQLEYHVTNTESPYWRYYGDPTGPGVGVVDDATLADAGLGNTSNGGTPVVYDDLAVASDIVAGDIEALPMECDDAGTISATDGFFDFFNQFEDGIWASLPGIQTGPSGPYRPVEYEDGDLVVVGDAEHAMLTTRSPFKLTVGSEVRAGVEWSASDSYQWADNFISFTEVREWEYNVTKSPGQIVFGWVEEELVIIGPAGAASIDCSADPATDITWEHELSIRITEYFGSGFGLPDHTVTLVAEEIWGSGVCSVALNTDFFTDVERYYLNIGADSDGSGGAFGAIDQPTKWSYLQVPGPFFL